MDPKTKSLLIILFIVFLLDLIWHFLIKYPLEADIAKKDRLLLDSYIRDYYKLIWIDAIFLISFVLYGKNHLPAYMFSPIYHAIFVFIGFIVLGSCYLTFKHGFTIGFNKRFIIHQSANKMYGLSKSNLFKGAYIRMRGIKARLTAVAFAIIGIIFILIGIRP